MRVHKLLMSRNVKNTYEGSHNKDSNNIIAARIRAIIIVEKRVTVHGAALVRLVFTTSVFQLSAVSFSKAFLVVVALARPSNS